MLRTRLLSCGLLAVLTVVAASFSPTDLRAARERQDRAAIDAAISRLQGQAQGSNSADAEYQLALAYSYAAEVAMEQRDKRKSAEYAESGVSVAQKAVEAKPNNAEYHRIYGNLCGQVIPANPLMGALKYGQCARDELNKALQLDAKNALAYVSRGVGNYYLPEQMGGGTTAAVQDFDKALAIDPKLSDAYLWKGIALRKANKNAEAHQALTKAVELAPQWTWAKEQLQKTPAQ